MTYDRAYRSLFRPDPEDLTRPEIRRLLDAALGEPEPDTELIEYYLDALRGPAPRATPAPARRWFGLKPALAAAIAVLLLLFGVTAATAVLRPELFDPLVRFYNDRIRIGHADEASAGEYAFSGSALAKDLADHGITPVLLPEALVNGTYHVDAPEYDITELIRSANIRFSDGNTRGTLVIGVYAPGAALPDTDYEAAENVETLDTGSIVCRIFDQPDHTVIDFSDGRTVYTVLLEGDREAAVRFAESIR